MQLEYYRLRTYEALFSTHIRTKDISSTHTSRIGYAIKSFASDEVYRLHGSQITTSSRTTQYNNTSDDLNLETEEE